MADPPEHPEYRDVYTYGNNYPDVYSSLKEAAKEIKRYKNKIAWLTTYTPY